MSDLLASLEASGMSHSRFKSPLQISATSSLSLLTTGSFETLLLAMTARACLMATGSWTKTTSLCMTALSGEFLSSQASKSRRVIMPMSLPPTLPLSVMGMQLQSRSA